MTEGYVAKLVKADLRKLTGKKLRSWVGGGPPLILCYP